MTAFLLLLCNFTGQPFSCSVCLIYTYCKQAWHQKGKMINYSFHYSIFSFIALLLISINSTGQLVDFTVTALAEPEEICQGEIVQLDVVVEGGSGSYAYLWTSIPAGFSTSLKNPLAKPDTSTHYIIKASDGTNTGYDTIFVVVHENPEPDIGEDTLICSGEAVIFDPGPGFTTYEWQDGSTQQTYTGSIEGFYWVEVSNSFGCYSRDSAFLNILEPPLKPAKPAGPSYIDLYLAHSSSYTTSTGSIDDYEWDLTPGQAGQVHDSGQMAVINWDTTFTGEARLIVRARNSCGYSNWSDSLRIHVVNSTRLLESDMIDNINVFPNPLTDEAILSFESAQQMRFDLVIYNFNGLEVLRQNQLLANTKFEITLNLAHLNPGIYTLIILSEHGQISRKLIRSE
jgi:hypothetical protein